MLPGSKKCKKEREREGECSCEVKAAFPPMKLQNLKLKQHKGHVVIRGHFPTADKSFVCVLHIPPLSFSP